MLSLHRDNQPLSQPDNTFRYALNAVKNEFDAVENERSTTLCAEFPEEVVGHLTVNNNETVVFTVSAIYVLNTETCLFTQVTACLIPNAKFVEAVYRILENCNHREVYWIDGVHELRRINIDDPKDCDFNVFKCRRKAELGATVLDSGGYLTTGTYQFAYRYDNANIEVISRPIYIYDEPTSDMWESIDGAPADTPTNKSIQLSLNTLDESAEYVELIVISTINGIISVQVIDKLTPTNILNFVYDGRSGKTISLNELLVPIFSYSLVTLITTFQNQLLVSGLKQTKNIDYQKYANEIIINWTTHKIPASKAYKIPELMHMKTFMGDEVYAFGIVGEFCDGTYTPVFHIPGRVKDLNDPFPVAVDNLDNFYECPKERWEVYNTAAITSTPHEESVFNEDCGITTFDLRVWERGTFGYNEQCNLYPDLKNCENERMYPEGNIRHHRMPDRALVPHFEFSDVPEVECIILEDDKSIMNEIKPYKRNIFSFAPNFETLNAEMYIYPISIEVLNIQPFEGIYKWHIVHVKRTDNNKTVIAKGITHKCFHTKLLTGQTAAHPHYNVNAALENIGNSGGIIDTNGSVSAYSKVNEEVDNSEEDCKIFKFHSPNTSFDSPTVNATHFVTEQEWKGTGRCYGSKDKNVGGDDCYVGTFNFNMSSSDTLQNIVRSQIFIKQRKIQKASYVTAHTTNTTFSVPFINLHQESGVAFELKYNLPFFPVEDPLPPSTACPDIYKDYSLGFEGDVYLYSPEACTYITCAHALYGSLKRVLCNQYGNLQGLEYKLLNSDIPTVESPGKYEIKNIFGDAFINYWSYRRTALLHYNQRVIAERPDQQDELPISCGVHGWYESDINVDMRHEGVASQGEIYYPKLSNGLYKLDSAGKQFTIEQSYLGRFHFNDNTNAYVNLGIDNYYGYNRDYSSINNVRSFFGYTDKYKTCECNSEFVNNIAVSDVKEWSIFRPNNLIQIPTSFGIGTNIFSLSNDLYYHTTDNLWRIFASDSRLETSASTVYIGNGSLFNATPIYLYATKEGSAGLQQKHGALITQEGYFFVDEKANMPYVFSDKLMPLNEDMSLFFRALPKNYDWHFGYDHYLKRLLLTVKFLDSDCSFTLSRLSITNKWFSYHSYLPTQYLNNRTNFFSINNNSVWKHNRENTYQTFYGVYYPHELELIQKSESGIGIWNNCLYLQSSYRYNPLYNKDHPIEETFTEAYLYNSTQFSGLLSLKPHTDLTDDYFLNAVTDLTNVAKVNRKERKWVFNEFDDIVVDYTIPNRYSPCIEPINTLINNAAINYNKPFYERARFRDFYLGQRFIFYKPQDTSIKLVTTVINNSSKPSIR